MISCQRHLNIVIIALCYRVFSISSAYRIVTIMTSIHHHYHKLAIITSRCRVIIIPISLYRQHRLFVLSSSKYHVFTIVTSRNRHRDFVRIAFPKVHYIISKAIYNAPIILLSAPFSSITNICYKQYLQTHFLSVHSLFFS